MTTQTRPARDPLGAVLAATVDVHNGGGHGVLVPGGYVLTAAHCLTWDHEGGMALSADEYREPAVTPDGQALSLAVHAVEPVADIALLGSVDDQRSATEAEAFEAFAARTAPVPLFRGKLEPFGPPLPVLVLNRDRTWVRGEARIYQAHAPKLTLTTEGAVESGASGGPVVTTAGELVGIVSWSNGAGQDGMCARVSHALPAWVLAEIGSAE